MSKAKLTWCLSALILSAAFVAAQELQPAKAPPVGTSDIALAVSPSNSPFGHPHHYGCNGCGEAERDVCTNGGADPCHHCRGCACSGRIIQWWQTRAKPCLQESHWGYAEQFEEKPFGSSLRALMNAQVCNGTKDRMVLYRYDFYEGILGPANELNPHGQRRLTELARMLRCNIYPLVIEPSLNDPALDEARRDHVLELLKDPAFECPENWVVVQRPNAKGLRGADAVGIDQKMLQGVKPGKKTTETSMTQLKSKTTEEPPTP